MLSMYIAKKQNVKGCHTFSGGFIRPQDLEHSVYTALFDYIEIGTYCVWVCKKNPYLFLSNAARDLKKDDEGRDVIRFCSK